MASNQLLIISGHIDGRVTGGVSMHVHRLLKRLIEPKVFDYMLCDYKKERVWRQLRKIRKASVMHIHASNAYLKFFYVLMGKLFKTKSIVTVHGKYGVYSPLQNVIHRKSLRMCDVPILINIESYEIVKRFNPMAEFIPAFIPPIESEEYLSTETAKRIGEIKADGKKLFVTNASSRAFANDGYEIYGIDFLVDYFMKHTEYNLVILDPSNEYTPLYENKISDNVRLINGFHSFCGLVEMSDVVIRNTSTDGDSFSVKEALYLHKPVLATDVVSRPKGVFLFRYNDADSLSNAIDSALSYDGVIELKERDATDFYYELYHKMGVA